MSFYSTLQVDYGGKFLVSVAIAYLGLRGITGAGVYALALPYYQELLGADAEEYHRTLLYVTLPWALKPLFGMLSDHVPLWGYRKRYYVVASSALTCLSCLFLSFLKPAMANAWFFVFVVIGIVTTDLLFEAKYSELMNASRTNVSGANIISYAWGLSALGVAIGSLWGSQMAHSGQIKSAFLLTSVPAGMLAANVYKNGMQESRREPKAQAKIPLLIIAVWLVTATLLSAVCVNQLSPKNSVIVQLTMAATLIYASLHWIPQLPGSDKTMAQCNVFLFLAEITAVRLTGATDYFFTADCPTGSGTGGNFPTPRFSYDFYLGWMPITASVAGLLGVFIFTKYLQHWPLRYVFQGVAVVRILLVGLEVWQAGRHNLGQINDKLLFFISEGMVAPVISMTYLLPLVAITARMMPKGNEALSYGILAGYQNFGQVIANSLGLFLIEKTNVGQNCNFIDYPFIVFCAHILAPLATIPLACLLVPKIAISPSKKIKIDELCEAPVSPLLSHRPLREETPEASEDAQESTQLRQDLLRQEE